MSTDSIPTPEPSRLDKAVARLKNALDVRVESMLRYQQQRAAADAADSQATAAASELSEATDEFNDALAEVAGV